MSRDLKNGKNSIIMNKLKANGSGVIIAFIALYIVLSIASPYFLTTSNIINILKQSIFTCTVGISMTLIISMGDIDLSVGSTLGISGVAIAAMIRGGVNVYLALGITLLLGCAIGLCNGLLITKLKMPAFIATLGTMSILRGLIMVYTGGVPIYGLRYKEFQFISQGYLGVIPFSIVVVLFLVALFYYLINYTKLGRYSISIGSNAEASKLVGINIDKVKIINNMISGLLCAMAGIFMTSRSEAATADAGSGIEMDVIAAVVIGGTALSGGRANLLGTVLGAILMTTIKNGLNLLGVNPLWHQVVIGLFVVLAVAIDSMYKGKEK